MAKKTVAKRWGHAEARAVLKRAEQSGMNDREFAKREGLDPQRIWWWRRRLGCPRMKAEEVAFVEVRSKDEAPQPPQVLEVRLGNGRSVLVPLSVEPTKLAELLDAIEGERC